MHGDLAVAQPFLRHAGPGAAIPVELTALDRDALVGAARIAFDHVQLHAEQLAQDAIIEIGRGADAGIAEIELRARQELLPRFDAGAVPGVADAEVLADIADPRIVEKLHATDLVGRRYRLGDQAGVEGRDQRAVGRRSGTQELHRLEARGTRNVLHDDGRLARDVTRHVFRQHAGVDVVAATG